MTTEKQATEVKQRHGLNLLAKAGVSGVGVEREPSGEYVLAVHLDSDAPAVEREIPDILDGVPVKRVVSGPFRKQ
jgi:hypothetical protein